MRRIRRSAVVPIGAVLVLLALVSTAPAQSPESPAELAARVDRLIQELGDEKSEVREKATAALVKIGSPAVAKLRAASKDPATEPSQLATDILKVIGQAAAGLQFSSQIKRPELMGAVTLVFSPDERFVYVPGYIAASINVFRRDASTGRLAHQQSVTNKLELAGVVTLHLNSDGKLAVAAACHSKSIALFTRDETTGELTLASMRQREPEGELDNLEWPIDAIFSTDDKFIYAIDDRKGTVLSFQIDEGNQLKLVEIFEGQGRCFDGARGLAAHPDGKTLYVSSCRAGTLVVLNRDLVSGKLSVRQIVRDEEDGVHGLAGTIYACLSRDGKFVYTVSGRFAGDDAIGVFQVGSDGKLSVLQEFINEKSELRDFAGGANGLTISPDGTRFYASGTKSRSLACFDRDPVSGRLNYVTTLKSLVTGSGEKRSPQLGANGIGISSDGRFLYLALEDGSAISVLERTTPQPAP
jgi:6-phosphogluconolactonase (cycloisomerase 2 family)